MIFNLIESLRPRQWTKNLLLFAGIIFSRNLLNISLLIKSLLAFLVFSLVCGILYLINDLMDLENDRNHPVKRNRPLASERLKKSTALFFCIIGMPALMVTGFILSQAFGWVLMIYVLLTLGYTFYFKKLIILDVMIISVGFVLRAVAGAVVINVDISSWLLVCTIFLALFLALNKRRNELILLGSAADAHRRNLSDYSVNLLDLLIGIVAACALMSYALYTTSVPTIQKFGTRGLILTLPFVVYGLFRYLYLVHQHGSGGNPEEVLLHDKSIVIDIFLYLLCVGYVVYFGQI